MKQWFNHSNISRGTAKIMSGFVTILVLRRYVVSDNKDVALTCGSIPESLQNITVTCSPNEIINVGRKYDLRISNAKIGDSCVVSALLNKPQVKIEGIECVEKLIQIKQEKIYLRLIYSQ